MQYTQQDIENASRGILKTIPTNYFYLDEHKKTLYKWREDKLVSCLADQARILNSESGSKKRKSFSEMKEVLSNKGIRWVEQCSTESDQLEVTIEGHSYFIRFSKGVDVALEYKHNDGSRSWSHCTANEDDIADFILFMSAVERRSLELLEQKSLKCHREEMLSEIELPSVELEVARFLDPKGIRYNLSHSNGHNRLEVQIVKEIWMAKNVTLDSLEDDLRIIPYLLKRPDGMKEYGRGFSIFHKWDWNKK